MTGVAQSARAGAGRLLGLGARAAFSTPGAVLGVALTLAAALLARTWVLPAFFLGDVDARRLVLFGAGGLAVVAALARGISLAWAVRTGVEHLRGGSAAAPGDSAVASTALTGLAWAVGAAAVHLALWLWVLTGLSGTGLAYVLGKAPLALLGAVGLAGVVTVGALLGWALLLWLEVALARAAVRGEGIAVAGLEAWRTLWQRAGSVLWALVATALPAAAVATGVRSILGMTPPPSWATVAAEATGLLLLALIEAVASVVRLDAYAALELDRAGALPPPPAAPGPAIPRAMLVDPSRVLEARLVPPSDPGAAR